MMSRSDITPHSACRVCGTPAVPPFLDFGLQPLANALRTKAQLNEPEFLAPLAVWNCATCGLSQLTHTVSPTRLYTDYLFRSETSPSWRQHCQKLAREAIKRSTTQNTVVLDIASNDGTLLKEFARYGCTVIGVDPAENVRADIPTLTGFWDDAMTERVRHKHGGVDIVTATNVLGHVDDVLGFLLNIRTVLRREGLAIIEVPSVMSLVQNNEFPTIYHEHLSYWSAHALIQAATRAGLYVARVELQAIHCGSLRMYLKKQSTLWGTATDRVLQEEARWLTEKPYQRFRKTVTQTLRSLSSVLTETKILWGYGASAKGTMLLNLLSPETPLPIAVIDDAPAKQGLYLPGVHLPVVGPTDLSTVDTLMLLSWNNADDLKVRAEQLGFAGTFLIPIPEPQLEKE